MVRVKTKFSKLDKKISNFHKKGQIALINQVYADMNRYVPKKDGDLRNQSQINPDNKSISYNVKYAAYQYYPKHSNYSTPGTGNKWDEKATKIHTRTWENAVKKAWERS